MRQPLGEHFGGICRTVVRFGKHSLRQVVALLLMVNLLAQGIGVAVLASFAVLLAAPGTAEAAAGDFSVYREVTGTDAVTATPADVSWDTTVTESANITLSGGTNIDLAEGGKYLVLYNVWTEEGSGGGTNRRMVETSLKLNGSTLPYGYGRGYIRDTDSDLTAYNTGAAIIDATAGDDLTVGIERTDANPSGATEIAPNTNGVSVLKLSDDEDYLRLQRTADITGVQTDTTFTDLAWDQADEVDTGSFAFSPTSENITVKGDADQYFLVTANVNLEETSGNGVRQNYEMRLTLDGAEIPGTRVTTYMRYDNGTRFGTIQYTGLIKKTAAGDQTLNIEYRNEGTQGSATKIVGGESALSIAALPPTVDVISLTSNGSQALTSAASVLNFAEQVATPSTLFSHDSVGAPSRVDFDADGDYLMLSTTYAARTSGTNRNVPVVEWQLDGSTIVPYGGHGSFNRGDQGPDDTFTSGASGGMILDGITSGQYIELLQSDPTGGTPNATFDDDRIALQGIALNDNFFGTDIRVSSVGSHVSVADIPKTDVYLGGAFAITETSASRNVTTITVSESGTVDGSSGLANIELYYDLDTSAPYDCASESYSGTETQYGATDTNGFSGADGSASFSGVVGVSPTQAMCVYVVTDITNSAADGETVAVSIDNPLTDVVVTGGGTPGPPEVIEIAGSTTLQNAELTQVHYHWLEDDGAEGVATSVEGAEDTPALGFAEGNIRRLRLQVSAEGGTSSNPVALKLEYATDPGSCSAATGWTDVGAVGGDWDMADSSFITDGQDSTDLAVGSGGTTNENITLLTPNGALRDTSSTLGALTFTASNFLEAEFAITPTASAPDGTTYCFRLTDNGTALRNYDIYPTGTISADVTVSAFGSHTGTVSAGTADFYTGGGFAITRNGTNRTVTDITLSEIGTVDASSSLSNIELYYELDTTAPYDCADQSYAGTEAQFGTTDTNGFSDTNGTSSFSGSVVINNTATMCVYPVLDVGADITNGDTIALAINNPASDVVVTSATVGPGSAVSPSGDTTVASAVLTQHHYHWRNDDGGETDATSASGGSEDTPLTDIARETTYRLRLGVSNEGTVTSGASNYRLEFGTKITTCENITNWNDVGAPAGAWDMSLSANITDGNTTNLASGAVGAITDENSTFVGTGALRETSSESGAITLSGTEFTELEYAIEATTDAGYGTTYCFRVSDAGAALPSYTNYAEVTLREKQDFFVQRGTERITGTSTTLVAGVDYTAPANSSGAFVRITNSHMTGAGGTVGAQDTPDDFTAYIEDPGNLGTSFTIARPNSADNDTQVSWEIIEYIGEPGADNEMVVRDTGTVTYGGSSLFATGTVASGVNDDSQVVVFITGQQNPNTGTNDFNTGLSISSWNSGTQQPVFERGDADGVAASLSYAVVEFTGLNWNVQRVEHTYATAGTVETESISPVISIGQTFLHAQKLSGDELYNLDEAGHEVFLSSIGAISFELESGATSPGEQRSVAWVIENTQTGDGAMAVYRSNGTVVTGGGDDASFVIAIGSAIDTSNASIYVNNQSTGAGNFHPRSILGATILNDTQYELYRADDGQNQDYRVEVVSWPVAEIALRQNYYRFYVDNDGLDPSDAWPVGAADLGENTSITAADDPLGEGEVVRLRMTVSVSNASLPEDLVSMKLQYGLKTTSCSAVSVWNDLGDPGSGAIWRGHDGSIADGTPIAAEAPGAGALNISVSDVAGTYEEANDTLSNPYSADIGEDIEYDWAIEHNGAAQRSDYCFRMVYADDSTLAGYNNYPEVRTTGYTPIVGDWRWYDDEASVTPSTALAAENTAPVDIARNDELKLRVLVNEVENAAGSNVKFFVQYSQYSDFADGGTTLTATSSCTATSTWCYADGGGVDNALIDSAVLTNADSCTAGSGSGCGTHNEAVTTTSTLTQPAGADMEFEYTLRHANARTNGVYYFRLVDANTEQPLVASSSYPSLVTEGAQLVFTVSGVDADTAVAGVTTDATSTATSIDFGSVTFMDDRNIAQELSVDTNAAEGYQVFMTADQQLQNSYGDPIDPIAASNASPDAWSTACSGAAVSCFGYHTTDATLGGGSGRFAPIDSYAALSTSLSEVMYSSVPAVDTHEVLYRIRVSEQQPAGDYTTQLTYIVVPIF